MEKSVSHSSKSAWKKPEVRIITPVRNTKGGVLLKPTVENALYFPS